MPEQALLTYLLAAAWAFARWGVRISPCDCLSCQTGRPDYPCLIEDERL